MSQYVEENQKAPLLVRAAKGEVVERPPVWLMRQAGRYMQEYQDIRAKVSTCLPPKSRAL